MSIWKVNLLNSDNKSLVATSKMTLYSNKSMPDSAQEAIGKTQEACKTISIFSENGTIVSSVLLI